MAGQSQHGRVSCGRWEARGREKPEVALGASEGETPGVMWPPSAAGLVVLSSASGAGLAVPHSLACPVPDWRFFTALHSSAAYSGLRAHHMRSLGSRRMSAS